MSTYRLELSKTLQRDLRAIGSEMSPYLRAAVQATDSASERGDELAELRPLLAAVARDLEVLERTAFGFEWPFFLEDRASWEELRRLLLSLRDGPPRLQRLRRNVDRLLRRLDFEATSETMPVELPSRSTRAFRDGFTALRDRFLDDQRKLTEYLGQLFGSPGERRRYLAWETEVFAAAVLPPAHDIGTAAESMRWVRSAVAEQEAVLDAMSQLATEVGVPDLVGAVAEQLEDKQSCMPPLRVDLKSNPQHVVLLVMNPIDVRATLDDFSAQASPDGQAGFSSLFGKLCNGVAVLRPTTVDGATASVMASAGLAGIDCIRALRSAQWQRRRGRGRLTALATCLVAGMGAVADAN